MAIATHTLMTIARDCMACVIANEYGVISVTKLCRSPPLAKKDMKLTS